MSASINRCAIQCALALSSLTCCISLALAQDAPDSASSPRTLDKVQVTGHRDARTEGSGSWATDSASTATRMELSPRETPQSVTIITRQRLDDMGVKLAQTTGVTWIPSAPVSARAGYGGGYLQTSTGNRLNISRRKSAECRQQRRQFSIGLHRRQPQHMQQ